jgi:uncharacterized repeat protein (TIGR01451 family)
MNAMKQPQQSRSWMIALFAVALMVAPATVSSAQAQQPTGQLAMSYQNLTLARDTARARKSKPTEVATNDTLRYSLVFKNTASRPISDVVFDNPLPDNMQLIGGSVTSSAPAKVEYSIDGGHTFSVQPMQTFLENGKSVQRPARPAEYTHIRWTMAGSVAAGASVTARYDVRVGVKRP